MITIGYDANKDYQDALNLYIRVMFPITIAESSTQGLVSMDLTTKNASIIKLVRDRLRQWTEYHEQRTHFKPKRTDSFCDEVADIIYETRKAQTEKLDLNISNESILTAFDLAQNKEGLSKLLF